MKCSRRVDIVSESDLSDSDMFASERDQEEEEEKKMLEPIDCVE